jgi:ribose 5-phosphate isomerase A
MTQNDKKRAAADAALGYIEPGWIVGVGTGTTTNCFIDGLGALKGKIEGAVASSAETAERLRRLGIPLLDLNDVDGLPIYVDGADEANRARELIKGGGGALTREKIIASASECFVCIIDDSKLVDGLGAFPLPVEVIPMAWRLVASRLAGLGGRPVLRKGVATDNGNLIIDLHDMPIPEPAALEERLNHIPGVVANGLFCRRPADRLIVAGESGVTLVE